MNSELCAFPECGREVRSLGHCTGHYTQISRGRKLQKLKQDMSLEERLMSHVRKSDGCWGWDKTLTSHKYPQIVVGKKCLKAHRVSYELRYGPIEPGMDVDHMCRNTLCVNPEHLQVVTRKENQENRNGAQVNSKSGVRGVFWIEKINRYKVCVTSGGRKHYGGTFISLEDAEKSAIELRLKLQTNNLMDREADRMARTNQGETK